MSLKDYLAALQALVATTPFVTATSFSYEERPPSAGLIKGNILFADGSQLDVKEFLITQPALRVIKYGYHYRKRAVGGAHPTSFLPIRGEEIYAVTPSLSCPSSPYHSRQAESLPV